MVTTITWPHTHTPFMNNFQKSPIPNKDVADVEKHAPGKLKEMFEFLRDYKIPDGKPANTFAFNNQAKNRSFAMQIIKEANGEWQKLISGQTKSQISL